MGSVRRDIKVHIRISSYQCGGVLLNHWYVATAAHCVHQAKLDKITVHLGEFDTKNNERVAMAPVSQEVAGEDHYWHPTVDPGSQMDKDKIDGEISHVAMKTGLERWHVIVTLVALVWALIGLCVWCVWRFFKKKRPKDGKKKNKEGKVEGAASKSRCRKIGHTEQLRSEIWWPPIIGGVAPRAIMAPMAPPLIPPNSVLNYQQVVETTIDEFKNIMDNGFLLRNGTLKTFSEEEKVQFRDLRRKGKNRMAARASRLATQSCYRTLASHHQAPTG